MRLDANSPSALSSMPLKKIAVAEDIATQIVILSSAKASGHVSGQVVTIAGGMEGAYSLLPVLLYYLVLHAPLLRRVPYRWSPIRS